MLYTCSVSSDTFATASCSPARKILCAADNTAYINKQKKKQKKRTVEAKQTKNILPYI